MFGVGHKGGQYIFWKKNASKPVKLESQSRSAAISATTDFSPSVQNPNKSLLMASVGLLSILLVLAGYLFLGKGSPSVIDNNKPKFQEHLKVNSKVFQVL